MDVLIYAFIMPLLLLLILIGFALFAGHQLVNACVKNPQHRFLVRLIVYGLVTVGILVLSTLFVPTLDWR